jgi:putative PIN family toxin of toxin-antitoxin system
LAKAQVTVRELVDGYFALAQIVEPLSVEAVVVRDPDDDAVIACAVASESEAIVSGDDDLLSLVRYRDIRMISAADLVRELNL